MKKNILLLILFCSFNLSVMSASKEAQKDFLKVIQIYKKSKGVVIDLVRTTEMTLLGQKKEQKGKAYIYRSDFRLEVGGDDASTIILNKKWAWMIQKLPQKVDGKINQVTKVKMSDLKKQKGSVLPLIFGDTSMWKYFNFTTAKGKQKNQTVYNFSPKGKKNNMGVQYLKMIIDGDKNKILEIEFKDEVENIVTYRFSNIRLNESISPKKFVFKPGAGDMVTEYK